MVVKALKFPHSAGSALIVVLWLTTIMTLMVSSLVLTLRRETAVARHYRDAAQLEASADSWYQMGVFMLLKPDPKQRWLGQEIYNLDREGDQYRVRVSAETGKVDLNSADPLYLRAIFRAVTNNARAEMIVKQIVSARSQIINLNSQLALDDLTQSYFKNVDDLGLISGIDKAILEGVRPWITVYSRLTDIDFEMAPADLLQVLKNSSAEFNIAGLSGKQTDERSQSLKRNIDTETAYTINVHCRKADGSNARRQAVIWLNPFGSQVVRVLDWRQGTTAASLFDGIDPSLLVTIHDDPSH